MKRQALDEWVGGLLEAAALADRDEVRRRLAEARADLSAAAAEGKDTSKLAQVVSGLEEEVARWHE